VNEIFGAGNDEAWIEGNTFSKKVTADMGPGKEDALTDHVEGINAFNGGPIATSGVKEPLERLADTHFSYSGAQGPDNWGHLTPAWLLTGAGRLQTPIDIVTANAIHKALPSLNFSYTNQTNIPFVHNGHTVQANYSGSLANTSSLEVNDRTYQLLQF